MIKVWFILSLVLMMFTSCDTIIHKKNNNYDLAINKYSKASFKYKNFFDGKITVEAILISNDVKKALEKDIKNNNLRKNNIPFSIKNNHLTFLVAFYDYDSKLNNLDEDDSIWNLTLILQDKKYKPTKVIKLFRSNHKIFKYYFKNNQRFSNIYLVEFNMLELNKVAGEIKLIFSSIEASLKLSWSL